MLFNLLSLPCVNVLWQLGPIDTCIRLYIDYDDLYCANIYHITVKWEYEIRLKEICCRIEEDNIGNPMMREM